MKIKKGDTVKVLSGNDKGKTGEVLEVIPKTEKIIVKGVNIRKKHQRDNGQNTGGIVEFAAPLDASNVMIVDPKTKKATRVAYSVDKDGKKIRVTKASGSKLN